MFWNEKLLYRTIGLYRLVISAYHIHIDNKPAGQRPLICSLMSVVFNSWLLQPKYLFVQELVVSDILQRGSRTNNTQALSAEEKFKNALSFFLKNKELYVLKEDVEDE